MTPAQYNTWLSVARRHSRVADEAEDLLQDALLIAVRAGRVDLDDESNRRWLTGVVRNQAAMRARSAVRRRQRETAAAPEPSVEPEPVTGAWADLGLDALPRSARSVLALALHGQTRDEICRTLELSSTAFRQRLVAVRRSLGRLPDDLQREALAVAYARQHSRADDVALGLMRRALLARLRVAPGLGTHDPDGHLIVLGDES